jgi:lipopolysaccharide/colanic/teichoic acid biosynthesis glycosyltransferase
VHRNGDAERLTLVHVTTVPSTLGFLQGQIGYLKSRGFDVWAVASPDPALEAFAREEGIQARGVEMARSITPLADLGAIARLWRIFREIRPAVVHGHTPKGGLLAMVAAFLAGVPVRIYTVHGLPLETARGWKRILLRLTERLSCLLAHRVYSVSPSLSRRVTGEGLCSRSKLHLLERGSVGGVDAETRFAPGPAQIRAGREIRAWHGIPQEALVIGFVGRLVRDKGVGELIGAWMGLRLQFPEAHLLVAGSFEPQDPIPPEAERILRSDPRIHLAGHVDGMPGMYAAMDVVALPTYREGFPQVALEAAAMGRPIVATRVTGCVDAVLDGSTGTLVPPGDTRALAEALRAYLSHPDLRERHGRAARVRVLREFRPQSLWRAMEQEYRSQSEIRTARPEHSASDQGNSSPRRPTFRSIELVIKRVLDIAGAVAGLLIASPLLAVIALATWITLGRPILFRQVRPGLKGKPIAALKFRTMRTGPGSDEERITPLGRFLRHTSFDEFPQLWNVLRGDMSLVGPRPLLMDYLKLYSPREALRHDVRPGLTGWCQVNGRNSLTWDRKFELDVWYVEHWSLLLDFKILLKTLARVVRRSGIEGPGNRCWPGFLGGGPVLPGTETDPFAGRSR